MKKKLYNPIIRSYDEIDIMSDKYCLHSHMEAVRKQSKLTQEELSLLTNMSISTISRIENGGDTNIRNILKYVHACGYELYIRRRYSNEKQ